MHCLELLLRKHATNPHKLSQIHALLITIGCRQLPHTTSFYNSLIKSHFKNPHPSSPTLHLFTQMLAHQTVPNHLTFPPLVKATASSPAIAHSLHSQILRRGLLFDDFVNCSLVEFYSYSGQLSNAQKVFDEMPNPDLASCNSMLNAFCINGDVSSAVRMFEGLPRRDVISWTTLINGFTINGRFKEAVEVFQSLVNGQKEQSVRPNEATLVSVLSACANMDSLGIGLRCGEGIHGYVVRNGIRMTAFLGTAVIDLYGKHGLPGCGVCVFQGIGKKEVCTWNAMISALAGNGRETEALDLFDEMRVEGKLRPNGITFVAVLTACARAKLVEQGLRSFELMSSEFGIVPLMEHYGCVVNLLSRAGMFGEACEFIGRMPMEPNASVWGALLGGCKVHRNAELGAEVGRQLVALQPWHSGRYMVLSNIYAEAGRWDVAEELRDGMGKAGVRKLLGQSWLDSSSSIIRSA